MNLTTQASLGFYRLIIKSQLLGKSALPYGLGLHKKQYQALFNSVVDAELDELNKQWFSAIFNFQRERAQLQAELVNMRSGEQADLIALLKPYQNPDISWSDTASTIVATACLSSAHLWKSLGFNQRFELSQWLSLHFPQLVAANNNNMRWKRFLYLQLCKQGGDYICRAPSCEQCSSFSECFSVE